MASRPPSLRGLLQQFSGMNTGSGTDALDLPDTSEQIYISALALLKMLKHGRAGVPMEVMGLMLGEFVDDYTVRVVDVFSMPQSGNSVSIEAVDYVYQTEMLEQLKRTGRQEMVVGWYHSHPGFGCWFSGTDVNTQQSFEQLNQRAVGVVVDPIQSVRGRVVMDCFRLINPNMLVMGVEPRQTTSNLGCLNRPTLTALVHGLNRNYYSISISCSRGELESRMLMHLNRNKWADALKLKDFAEHGKEVCSWLKSLRELSLLYRDMIAAEEKKDAEALLVERAGKIDAKQRIQNDLQRMLGDALIMQSLGTMVSTLVF